MPRAAATGMRHATAQVDDVLRLVYPEWPPLAHVRRGWNALDETERAEVARRIDDVLSRHAWRNQDRQDALLVFTAFLAQVETIAIEIPLRFLPTAPPEHRALLRRQLVDEVFHSLLFARLAHGLALPHAQPPPPLASAERLLETIRREPDLGLTATMLNLVAEGWIETVFRHGHAWGVAPAVFSAVLADESRHVAEADLHRAGVDPVAASAAVARLEQGLAEAVAEPTVGLALLDLAGRPAYEALVADLHKQHRERLQAAGLAPSAAWENLENASRGALSASRAAEPTPIADTPWRRAARAVWDSPRDPSMLGTFDVRVGHIRRRLLTPILIAAVGRAWAEHPELNRVLMRDRVWRLPRCNVGVRVALGDGDLATIVVTDADRRSVKDIQRLLRDGRAQVDALRRHAERAGPLAGPGASADAGATTRTITPPGGGTPEGPGPVLDATAMRRLADLAPPAANQFSVAFSNSGRYGLPVGAGSLSGDVAPSTDFTVGQRRRLPAWFGVAYLPAWHVTFGGVQDHRVFDGNEAGLAVTAVREQLTRAGVRRILAAPDTLADTPPTAYDDAWFAALPPELRLLSTVGFGKYTPIVVGSAAVGVAGGVGAYLLIQQHIAATAAASTAAAAAGPTVVDLSGTATSEQPAPAAGKPEGTGQLERP